MSIFAISDLHLAFSNESKSMELFGEDWKDYQNKIKINWENTVSNNDTVIIPGDISWAINLDEAYDDFNFLNNLPGKKIIMKGNHDYYFTTVAKLKKYFKDNNFNTIEILHNNSFYIEGYNICGSRLWSNTELENADDTKIFRRELIRLKLSLESVLPENVAKPIIVATHFPPFRHETLQLLKEYNVEMCVYGHLHGQGHYMIREGNIDGIEFKMVSGDHTGFNLVKLN